MLTMTPHLDRDPDIGSYNCQVAFDRVHTLTTANAFLFLFSVDDIAMPDEDRKLMRYLTAKERFKLQGFDPAISEDLPKKRPHES